MNDDFLERVEDDEEELYRSYVRPAHPWMQKLFFWLTVVGGIAIGICFFLFFLTLFIYIFLPLLAVFLIWMSFKKWQWDRQWRKMSKQFED